MERPELQPLRDTEKGSTGWPAIQPVLPRKGQYFLCGKSCGCCPIYVIFVPALGFLAYLLGFVVFFLVVAAALLVYACCGCCVGGAICYFKTWRCSPFDFLTDIYPKLTYFAYQSLLLSRKDPDTSPTYLPVDKITPKQQLDKYQISYALNIKVPVGFEEEFLDDPILPSRIVQRVEEVLSYIPQNDTFDTFTPDEDPVAYAMKQMGSVYPEIYQVWEDKWSDVALTRFCLYGLGAHRIETTTENGQRYYVVRTNALSALAVRDGFERYGGDAYFDMDWKAVKIVDAGLGPLPTDGNVNLVTSTPGDAAQWLRAKFRFRSSLSVLVTLVDHLYGVHLQTSNIVVTAVREQLSADHPLRRFLTPFTFQTIAVNDNARNNLIQPRSMGPRCFAFDDVGMQLAFAAAPSLILSGVEVGPEQGGPYLNRAEYIDYLKDKQGIDTEYYRQSKKYYLIIRKFLVDYFACYYPSKTDVVADKEMQAMLKQLVFQLELLSPSAVSFMSVLPTDVDVIYNRIVDIISNFVFVVTAGHEQVGAVEAYVQDVSFCAFKWVPDALVGTKQTATAQTLLMSFTSTPMPKLLGSDWTHLFTPATGSSSPSAAFTEFQQALQTLSQECDAYNAAASSRPFPECFPMYVINPKMLETSISV